MQIDLEALVNSFSFRLGQMLVQAVRWPGRNTVLLPYRLVRLCLGEIKKRKRPGQVSHRPQLGKQILCRKGDCVARSRQAQTDEPDMRSGGAQADATAESFLPRPVTAPKISTETSADRQYYTPPAGIDLDCYMKDENKQGVHHSVRYLWAIEAISELPGISRIVDVGCGEGYGANAVAEAHPRIEVVAIDSDQGAVSAASRKYQRPNLEFIVGDARQFYSVLGEESFDLAISFDLVEHIEHRDLYFTNLTRYLRPGGILFLSTPCGGRRPVRAKPAWAHHKIEYNAYALYDVLRRYFLHVYRIDDPHECFPARHVFDRLEGGAVSYLNLLNPVVCRDPIKIKNPYTEYLEGVEATVTFD